MLTSGPDATMMACMMPIRIARPGRTDRSVVFTPEIEAMLRGGAAVPLGVSGGKDSCALAFATVEALDAIGHTGPRILIHSDLGRVEWRDSLPTCERLAARLGLELVVVRRQAGDMMDRWLGRWANNLRRYAELSCVKLILPWSTPAMRFCTSELKTAVICRELVRRFPGKAIVSCTGIRREESRSKTSGRAIAPIGKREKRLESKKHRTSGVTWNPIIEWSESDVRAYLAARGFDLHEGYTRYRMSRISCMYCIMGSEADLAASTTCPDNHATYREQVGLEIVSTFAFQGSRWLGDVAPHLLDDAARAALAGAKVRAELRVLAENRIPQHLLYVKGWPTVMPTEAEAELIAEVRRAVAAAVGIEVRCTTAAAVMARYAELMAMKASKAAANDSDDDEAADEAA
jgi:3'-phosphoadenosine 5'-phosphosulfate sulfotransferase (PAPS reductase)/FAD synthetase